jgi:D-alanyl-D-alanine carboxypeptidase
MSAFRSPEFQRDLFMDRLGTRGVTSSQILSGNADYAINENFKVTAVPGYSRHHTGYAVDFWCEDRSGNFGNSICFTWLKANNYLHAKEFGWIPSYPEDADEQGPEPEPWEYVWVGREVLYE